MDILAKSQMFVGKILGQFEAEKGNATIAIAAARDLFRRILENNPQNTETQNYLKEAEEYLSEFQ